MTSPSLRTEASFTNDPQSLDHYPEMGPFHPSAHVNGHKYFVDFPTTLIVDVDSFLISELPRSGWGFRFGSVLSPFSAHSNDTKGA